METAGEDTFLGRNQLLTVDRAIQDCVVERLVFLFVIHFFSSFPIICRDVPMPIRPLSSLDECSLTCLLITLSHSFTKFNISHSFVIIFYEKSFFSSLSLPLSPSVFLFLERKTLRATQIVVLCSRVNIPPVTKSAGQFARRSGPCCRRV